MGRRREGVGKTGKRGTSRREEEKYKLGNEESKVYERKKIREGQLK